MLKGQGMFNEDWIFLRIEGDKEVWRNKKLGCYNLVNVNTGEVIEL